MEARGFLNQSTDMEGLDRHLASAPRTAYLGCDPTADSLHVGHLVPVMMMRWFQKFGHRPVLLVGGATAHIGDPDKDVERPLMTLETIRANSAGIGRSYGKFLDFSGDGAAIMVDNYDWFKDVNYLSFLREVGTVVSVNKLVALDRIKKRLDGDLHLSFLELNYPLFQSYDFLVLKKKYGCDIQICGADQWGNAIGGVDLIKRKTGGDSFVLTAPLLVAPSGKKMGKSEGNAVWINDDRASAFDYYQYFRNVDDAMVGRMLSLFTELPLDEIARLSALGGAEANEAKKVLAFEATKICRGKVAADGAAETARQAFEQGAAGEGLPRVAIRVPMGAVDAAIASGLVDSRSEAKRHIAGGGLSIDGVKISDEKAVLDFKGSVVMSLGKKKKVVLTNG
jgi:tyrosyl-tRNA synthetase